MKEASNRIGRIRIEELLGAGGMGEVYRGYDEVLQREVAVKSLRPERRMGSEGKARFLREARLLSQLDHPAICRVYDLVEGEDTDHLVLELVRGRTLTQAALEGLTENELLRIFQAVAEALEAAHDERIVHRDLKPDNVMITEDGQVKVLDFGIARSLDQEGVIRRETPPTLTLEEADPGARPGFDETASMEVTPAPSGAPEEGSAWTATLATRLGSIIGTPLYMSPEQAAGEPVTDASDMYSFGVLMHELLAGVSPYGAAEGMDLLLKVYRAETGPLAGVDQDLARLVAELESVDPMARPSAPDAVRRLRWIRQRPQRQKRRKLRLALAASVTAILLAAGAIAVYSRLEAGRRAAIAQQFAQEAESIAWLIRAEELSPIHDIRPARDRVRQRIAELEARMEDLGSQAAGPGAYAIGRAQLALGNLEAARLHLDAAWAEDYRSPEVAYALGVTYGGLYSRELEEARRIGNEEAREQALKDARTGLRGPAIKYLAASEGASQVSPRYMEGLIALYEERFEEGLEIAAAIDESPSWYVERDLLLGDLNRRYGQTTGAADRDLKKEQELLASAAEAYQRASTTARSHAVAHQQLCDVRTRVIESCYFSRDCTIETLDLNAAAEPCQKALEIDPELVEAHLLRAGGLVLRARYEAMSGKDPLPIMQLASETVLEAIDLDPKRRRSHAFSAWVHQTIGTQLHFQGDDGTEALDRAVASSQRLLELSPGDVSAASSLGGACHMRAEVAVGRGDSPLPWLKLGIEALHQATEIEPENQTVWFALGDLLRQRALHEEATGGDAIPWLDELLSVRRRTEGSPGAEGVRILGYDQMFYGSHILSLGQNPTEYLKEALDNSQRAIDINPQDGYAQMTMGFAHYALARWKILVEEDPWNSLQASVSSFEESIELTPGFPQNHINLARVLVARAERSLEEGRSPEPDIRAARQALATATERLGETWEMSQVQGTLDIVVGRWMVRLGRSPEQAFASGLQSIGRSLEHKPGDAAAYSSLAELHLWRAAWLLENGQPAADDLAAGIQATHDAVEINQKLAWALVVRAGLLSLAARGESDSIEQAKAMRESESALSSALEKNPLLELQARQLLDKL